MRPRQGRRPIPVINTTSVRPRWGQENPVIQVAYAGVSRPEKGRRKLNWIYKAIHDPGGVAEDNCHLCDPDGVEDLFSCQIQHLCDPDGVRRIRSCKAVTALTDRRQLRRCVRDSRPEKGRRKLIWIYKAIHDPGGVAEDNCHLCDPDRVEGRFRLSIQRLCDPDGVRRIRSSKSHMQGFHDPKRVAES